MKPRNEVIPIGFLIKNPEIWNEQCKNNTGKHFANKKSFEYHSVSRNFTTSIIFILLFGFLSCNSHTKQTDKSQPIDTIVGSRRSNKMDTVTKIGVANKIDKSKYYVMKDTLTFTNEIGETFKYGKKDFNELIDNYPELTSDYPANPDQAYYCRGMKDEFGSEAGQDNYFTLYAYFLKNRDGDNKYSERRKRLIDIYQNINSLFGYLKYGGSYFGHQHTRILAYAEYSVYLYKQNEANFISKTYDITKQKELYIKSLRQLISDERSIDPKTKGQAQNERVKKLNKIVDDIDKAITDSFYLRKTQNFHYGYYQYY